MNEQLFAYAQHPSKSRVLGLSLQPYSIGHDILLLREENPAVKSQLVAPFDSAKCKALMDAAIICSNSWEQNQKPQRNLKIWWALNKYRDFKVEAAEFHIYRVNGMLQPWIERPDGCEGSRAFGSPLHAMLIQFLIGRMCKTEIEALNYPFGLAKFHFYAHAEQEGTVKVINEQEQAFEDYCRAEDEKAAKAKAGKE